MGVWAGGPLADRASKVGMGRNARRRSFLIRRQGGACGRTGSGLSACIRAASSTAASSPEATQRHPITVVSQKLVATQEDLASASPGRCSGVSSSSCRIWVRIGCSCLLPGGNAQSPEAAATAQVLLISTPGPARGIYPSLRKVSLSWLSE